MGALQMRPYQQAAREAIHAEWNDGRRRTLLVLPTGTGKDVMTELGFWTDDAQVASELCEKFWAEIPGIYILLTGLEE